MLIARLRRGCPAVFRRWPHRLLAFHPSKPMAHVVIKLREPIDRELAELRSAGDAIAEYRTPGVTITVPQKLAKVATKASPSTAPDDAPTAVLDAPAPESEPTPVPTLKRAQLAALLAEIPQLATLVRSRSLPRT